MLLGVALLVSCLMTSAWGYNTGAPISACQSMTPGHYGLQQLDINTMPYNITVSSNTYETNGQVRVTIEKTGATGFKGFFLQARKSGTDTLVGDFTGIPSNAQTRDCSGGQRNAVTHTLDVNKDSIVVTWNAPAQGEGDIHFVATIAKEKLEVYVKASSVAIKESSTDPSGPPCTPLEDSQGNEIFCGRGPSREDCPKEYYCEIEPADRWAVCCTGCVEGSVKLADDGCNNCTCSGNAWACTEMACLGCVEGSVKPDDDGCNNCTCSGDAWACTAMACLDDDGSANTAAHFDILMGFNMFFLILLINLVK